MFSPILNSFIKFEFVLLTLISVNRLLIDEADCGFKGINGRPSCNLGREYIKNKVKSVLLLFYWNSPLIYPSFPIERIRIIIVPFLTDFPLFPSFAPDNKNDNFFWLFLSWCLIHWQENPLFIAWNILFWRERLVKVLNHN